MPRQARSAPGGLAYHVLNRANGRMRLFGKQADYLAFEQVLQEAIRRTPTRLLSWCLMPNHWHLVIWPRKDGELTEFVRWLTHTHVQRWHAHHHSAGTGHVYQGRFNNFPIQEGEHVLRVCRYVERNAVRPTLVKRAEDWRWSSLWVREHESPEQLALLSEWPVPRPANWVKLVNQPQTARELEALKQSIKRSAPYGADAWQKRIAKRLDLEWTLRPRGRPRVRPIINKESRPL